ncbi:unnamed protein product [Closterium sp. NIES-64]|nr:unnamed protein product [Closterium sp. NIES-64]
MHEVSNLITDGDGGAKVVAGRKAPTVIAQTERRDRKVVAAVKALASQPSQRGFVAEGMSVTWTRLQYSVPAANSKWCCVRTEIVIPSPAPPPFAPPLFPNSLPPLPSSPLASAPSKWCCVRAEDDATIYRKKVMMNVTGGVAPGNLLAIMGACATIYRKKVMMNVRGGRRLAGNRLAVMGQVAAAAHAGGAAGGRPQCPRQHRSRGIWKISAAAHAGGAAGGRRQLPSPAARHTPQSLLSTLLPLKTSPEGSGKSLLLHMLAGRLEGDANFRGSIEYSGEPFGATLRREIGFVENDVDLQANLTVRICLDG